MKKSQIKFGESIGVIIIVYIVVLVGVLWFNNINAKSLNEMFEKDENQRAYEKYQYINNLDLIHVSEDGVVDSDFDLVSLLSMEKYSKTKNGSLFFRKQLGESIVSVDLYDYTIKNDTFNVSKTIILYNFTKNNLKTDKVIYKTLIPIYNDISKNFVMGLLKVEVSLS